MSVKTKRKNNTKSGLKEMYHALTTPMKEPKEVPLTTAEMEIAIIKWLKTEEEDSEVIR